MFEGAKAKLRDWGDRLDDRLCGISPDSNHHASMREVGNMVLSPSVIRRVNDDRAFYDIVIPTANEEISDV